MGPAGIGHQVHRGLSSPDSNQTKDIRNNVTESSKFVKFGTTFQTWQIKLKLCDWKIKSSFLKATPTKTYLRKAADPRLQTLFKSLSIMKFDTTKARQRKKDVARSTTRATGFNL